MSFSPHVEPCLEGKKSSKNEDDLESKGTVSSTKGQEESMDDVTLSESLFFKSEERKEQGPVSPFLSFKRKFSSGIESLRGRANSAMKRFSSEKRTRRIEDVSVERYLSKERLQLKIDPAHETELKQEQIALLKSEEERLREELQLITNIWSEMKKQHLDAVQSEETKKAKMIQDFERWKNVEKSKLIQLEVKQKELEKEMKFRTEKIALLRSRLDNDKKKRDAARATIHDVAKKLNELQEECRREEKAHSHKLQRFLQDVEQRRNEALASINKYRSQKEKLQSSLEQRIILRRAVQPEEAPMQQPTASKTE